MSDSTVHNLLTRAMRFDNKTVYGVSFSWDGDWFRAVGTATGDIGWRAYRSNTIPVKAGKMYTLSVEFADGMPDASEYFSTSFQLFSDFSKNTYKTVLGMYRNEHVALSVDQSTLDAYHVGFQIWGPIIRGGATVDVRVRWMLVEGDTPAAWAPAEGEGLAGGGALMSANLLEGVTPTLASGTTESDGVWHNAGRTSTDGHKDWLVWDLAGQSALATNQTYHVGLSAKGASADASGLHMVVAYKDAAGNRNWVWSASMPVGTEWSRAEGTVVIPSGMTITALTVSTDSSAKLPEVWLTNATLSYGSPVTLASDAHTPYATQDHVMVTYATKASLKVTDDSVKAEVSARAQTDRNVADLSSRLTQTANSLSSEISDRRTAITTVTGLANAAQSTADSASEQTVELSSRLDQSTTDITATIESKVQTVQQGVDDNASDVKNLNDRLSDEIRTRKSFMRFSEESSDPTLTLGQTDSPAQVKLTNRQLQFLYMAAVVAYISNDALLIRNATILQQLVLGGFAFVPRENGNLALKWVG